MTCDRRNPLKRSGTHQDGRVPNALSPDSFRLDDRSLPEMLRYAARYGRELKYYNETNNIDGDWTDFFSKDPAAVLAGASLLQVHTYHRFSLSLRHFVDNQVNDPEIRKTHTRLLFWLPVLLLTDLLAICRYLPRDHDFSRKLGETCNLHKDALIWVLRVYRGAVSRGVITDAPLLKGDYNLENADDGRPVVPDTVARTLSDAEQPLSSHSVEGWSLTDYSEADWATLFGTAVADPTPFMVQGTNIDLDGIQSLLRYNLFNRAYHRLLVMMERITREAGLLLESSLNEQGHDAHYGLLIAFLKMFENNQHELNNITDRHLQYYYQDVLKLPREQGRADSVHLTFELKKNAKPVLLAAGTLVRAGDDAAGNPLNFGLSRDFVPNQAKLEARQSLFVPTAAINGNTLEVPYASPVTDSADGLGVALAKDATGWPAFGPFAGVARGRLGFAIADRQLFLREARRTITLVAHTRQSLANVSYTGAFNVFLTGEKEWFQAVNITVTRKTDKQLQIVVGLDGDDPAVVAYDEKAHASGFSATAPMLRIELALEGDNASQGLAAFQALRHITLDSVELKVKATGLRNFSLKNDFGSVDTSKPFLPFGPMPEAGASMVLGSSEIFSKPLDDLVMHIQWEQAYSNRGYFIKAAPEDYRLSISHLSGGEWQDLPESPLLFKFSGLYVPAANFPSVLKAPSVTGKFEADQAAEKFQKYPGVGKDIKAATDRNIRLGQLDGVSFAAEQTLDNPLYGTTQRQGYLKFSLSKGFGFSSYQNERVLALISEAKRSPNLIQNSQYNYDGGRKITELPVGQNPYYLGGQPKPPYLPKMLELTLDYETESSDVETFIELHPFGWRYGGEHLLPETGFEGELFLGFKDVGPPSKVSMLIRSLEGSSNPLKNPAELTFSWLKGDDWIDLEPEDISDSSYSLSSTGIVSVAVPREADTDHYLLSQGLYWLRIAAAQDTDALSDLIEILPNATTAIRILDTKSPLFPQVSLPGATITRLKDSMSEIKGITQPDASFDGRPSELDNTYYHRVAERLRHKDRAVSMWDYEHLVLQKFPEIYKVKCLNHTLLQRDTENNIVADNEVRPGSVVVVPLPYVHATSDQRRPYARKRTLLDIRGYLKKKVSPFVRLEVQNPRVEEVQMQFGVAFHPEFEFGFYKQLLNDEIVKFLTPWMYDNGQEIEFGGRWAKSSVIAFVERLDYVDYVKDVLMFHRKTLDDDTSPDVATDVDVVQASTGRSVLVSHADHVITNLNTDEIA